MAKNSKIEWTHHTFNHVRGCTKVSEGCRNCYALDLSKRNPAVLGVWGPRGTRAIAAESYWRQPIKWNREAEQAGERRRVFCASLADVFEGPETMPAEAWPAVEAARLRLFGLIDTTPWLDWLLLTKRPENIEVMAPERWDGDDGFPANVWVGTSVENQEEADRRIPELLKVQARVRFLSCEPLLGPVDLRQAGAVEMPGPEWAGPNALIDWVIVGGESGAQARPMHPDWARSLRDQCQAAGVAYHFKQWGEWAQYNQHGAKGEGGLPYFSGNPTRKMGDGFLMERYGKRAAGRLLDGRTWDEFPTDKG